MLRRTAEFNNRRLVIPSSETPEFTWRWFPWIQEMKRQGIVSPLSLQYARIPNPLLKWLLCPHHSVFVRPLESTLRLAKSGLCAQASSGLCCPCDGGGEGVHFLAALRPLASSSGSQMAIKADGCTLRSLVTCGSDNEVFWCADTFYSVTMVFCLWWHHLICPALRHLWKASIFTRVPAFLLLLFFSVRLNFSQRENIARYWFPRTR